MDKDAITTCPRKREALKAIKAYMKNRKRAKVDKLVNNTYNKLRAEFPLNLHHEDYRKIIHEAIEDFINTRQLIQSQRRNTVSAAANEAE